MSIDARKHFSKDKLQKKGGGGSIENFLISYVTMYTGHCKTNAISKNVTGFEDIL